MHTPIEYVRAPRRLAGSCWAAAISKKVGRVPWPPTWNNIFLCFFSLSNPKIHKNCTVYVLSVHSATPSLLDYRPFSSWIGKWKPNYRYHIQNPVSEFCVGVWNMKRRGGNSQGQIIILQIEYLEEWHLTTVWLLYENL